MKAQVALEFMFIFGVFLMGVTVVALSAWNGVANAERASVDFEARRVLNLASDMINTAYLEGDGFYIGFAVPEKIGTQNYTIQIEGSMLWLTVSENSYSDRLLTPNITGSLAKGENTLSNVNGVVVIS